MPRSSKWSLPFKFSEFFILYAFLISLIHVICPTCLIILDLITPVILRVVYRYEAPHYAVLSILLPLPPS